MAIGRAGFAEGTRVLRFERPLSSRHAAGSFELPTDEMGQAMRRALKPYLAPHLAHEPARR